MEVIFEYSRAQAIADGVLIDVSWMADEAGFRFPVALTSAVWGLCVDVPENVGHQDENGRLWDLLTVLRHSIRQANNRHEIHFDLSVRNCAQKANSVALKAACGPGDDLEPVITVMLHDED